GKMSEAHRDFQLVTERDPNDGHAWYKLGATYMSPEDPTRPAGLKDAPRLIEIYSKALECNPYLVSAMYKLQQAYAWAGQPLKHKELQERWMLLDPKRSPTGPGDTAEAFYGESGKYARVIDPFPVAHRPAESAPPPRFHGPESIV